ncbi:hypothetical protein QJQ45_030025 [Haematococcus lacustris]|nr:hypothetical protein QJQ45_030025 [Haematococcus lacustris]
MNWWPEAFPCRAAFAAVGLATRDYFPGKHGVLFLRCHSKDTSAQPSPAQPDLVPWGIGSKARCLAVP